MPVEGREPATLDYIANVFGLTRERIRQIEVALLPKIERALRSAKVAART
jgi:DNA-directed RNA polymerase sigma subunit (sigma70/sigma32)